MCLCGLARHPPSLRRRQTRQHSGLIYRPFEARIEEVQAALYKDLVHAGSEPDAAGL